MTKRDKLFTYLLENKGRLATIIGLIFALPVEIKLTLSFYRNIELTRGQLITAAVLNGIAIIWFILPSIIEIKAGKFHFIVKD